MAPPTRDTTFNPHTPPMASYYYHCAGAGVPVSTFVLLRPLEDVRPPPTRHVEVTPMRPSPFL